MFFQNLNFFRLQKWAYIFALFFSSVLTADSTNIVSLRQTQGNGFGYQTGYTTLESFLVPEIINTQYAPFIDIRAHHFNNGKWAANFGMGVRNINCYLDAILGANLYFDFRNTQHKKFQQVGFGFEFLHCCLDARINVYLPIASAKSHAFDCQTNIICNPTVAGFSQNSLLISQIIERSKKYEMALKGVNLEFGKRLFLAEYIDVYLAAGPYFFTSSSEKNIWGGSLRGAAQIYDYITLEVDSTYDKLYHSTVSGKIGISIPFGCNGIGFENCCSCNDLQSKMTQRVCRNEIIALHKKTKRTINEQTIPVINPLSGIPLRFIFVNNTNPLPGNGTFENPFNSLSGAQFGSVPNDIIYVFHGDGTTLRMDHGIILQDNQQFLGTGVTYTFPTQCGTVSILDPGTPHITNLNGNAVELANNNIVQGFFIDSPIGSGVNGSGINIALVQGNTITNPQGLGGISFEDCTGNLNVFNNTINLNALTTLMEFPLNIPMLPSVFLGSGISVMNHNTTSCITTITDNMINTNFTGISVYSFDKSTITSTISRNKITGNNTALTGIDDIAFNESTHITVIDSNSVNDIGAPGGFGIFALSTRDLLTQPITFSFMESHIINNTVSNSGQLGFGVGTGNGAHHSTHIINNTAIGNGTKGFVCETSNDPGGDVFCVQLLNNFSDNGYSLKNFVGILYTNTFDLEPPVGNTGGPITMTGVITPVPPGTCP